MIDIDRFIRPSSLSRIAACPASAQMEAACAERFPEIEARVASMGTDGHRYVARVLADPIAIGLPILDDWTQRCAEDCIAFAHQLIAEHQIAPDNVLIEHKMDGADLGLVKGGTADLVLVVPFETVIVVDWKLGWIEQAAADVNDQALAYGIMAARTFRCKRVLVYLYQPRADEPASAGEYDAETLKANEQWVRVTTANARDTNAELRPSLAACSNCRALPHCQAAKEYAMRAKEALEHPIGPSTPDEWADLIERAKLMEKMAEAGLTLAKTHLSAGGKATGWEIGPERTQKYIEDAEACFNVCATSSSHASQFWKSVTVSRTELDKQFGSQRDRYRSLLKEKVIAGSLRKAK